MFFKKKRMEAVTKRSPDTTPFEIPEILSKEEKRGYQKNKFVSPVFGTKVKDEVVIPTPHERKGDLDRQFDSFRTKPKLTKENMKKKYGSEFPEFDMVKGKNLQEAIKIQERKLERKKTSTFEDFERINELQKKQAEEYSETVKEEVVVEKKTNINDFFNKKEMPKQKPQEEKPPVKQTRNKFNTEYKLPPFSLLSKPLQKSDDGSEWIQNQIDVLNKTFEEFGVGARVLRHTKGPTVTRYEIVLESGVKIQKVTSIEGNIKMALAAKEIRLEAPIPGKSTIGIEVPNEVADIVHFIDIVNKDEFIHSTNPLSIAIGLDIDGKGVYSSIAKMPHGLVAGATNSGKSVCINTIVMSLLFKYSPDELKLMLIDPKMVELSAYNDLPHLVTPVITDAKIATAGLKWAVEEMERRFIVFSNERVKDIKSYNVKAQQENIEHMPYIVIIVDELADLMMVASSSVEEAIMRLTQKARACGIHLIIATQRPSTDVVKGTIKSNIPTRIAFSVSSYIDSMTIIDSAGADKLLGRGDMLFCENGQVQRRVQGAYISDSEIQNVNEFIRRQRDAEFLFSQEKLVTRAAKSDVRDELLEEVALFVVRKQEASINKISKEFRIGFNRAQKIVEMLCELGVVSDNVGSKARDVLVSEVELETIL